MVDKLFSNTYVQILTSIVGLLILIICCILLFMWHKNKRLKYNTQTSDRIKLDANISSAFSATENINTSTITSFDNDKIQMVNYVIDDSDNSSNKNDECYHHPPTNKYNHYTKGHF